MPVLGRVRQVGLATAAAVLLTTLGVSAPAGASAPAAPALPAPGEQPHPEGREHLSRSYDARRAAATSNTEVVVRFRDGVSSGRRAEVARAAQSRSRKVAARLGVEVLSVRDARASAAVLEQRPEVLYAEPLLFATRFSDETSSERREIGINEARNSTPVPLSRGEGQVVAVIDDGVNARNSDLLDRVDDGGFFDSYGGYHSDGGDLAGPSADNWHGTAVSAVIAGNHATAGGVTGVVPAARVRSYRVFGLGEEGASSAAIASALDRVAEDTKSLPCTAGTGLCTVNMSLGIAMDSRLVRDAVARFSAAAPRVTLVAAAGNDFGLRPNYPAGYAGVLSVGASAAGPGGWQQADFSTKADVDVLAPGKDIRTWEPNASAANGAAPGPVDGTSFAAPQVAGIAAALAGHGVAGATVRAAIKASAEPANRNNLSEQRHPSAGDGSGRADALTALKLATGTTPYSAVFVDGGQVLGSVTDRRAYEAVRVSPGAAPAPPSLSVSDGSVVPGPTRFPAEPGVAVATGTYVPPSFDVGRIHRVALHVHGAGETGDESPLALVPASAGDVGLAAGDGTQFALSAAGSDGSGYRFDLLTASAYLVRGQRYTLTVTHPRTDSTPLLWFPPPTEGGTASVMQEEAQLLINVPGCEFMEGAGTHRCTVTAPRSGRFAFSLFNDGAIIDFAGAPAGARTSSFSVFRGTTLTAPPLTSATLTRPAVSARWSGTPGLRYDVDRIARNAGAPLNGTWQRWLTRTTDTSALIPAAYGDSTLVRVRAVYPDGSQGAWSKATRSVSPYDERTRGMAYSRGWTSRDVGGHWGRGVKQAKSAGSTFTFRTSGYRYTIVGDRCSACGQAKVYVDGRYRGTFDSYSRTGKARQQLWTGTASGGSAKVHTVKVVVQGTSRRPWVKLDGFAAYR